MTGELSNCASAADTSDALALVVAIATTDAALLLGQRWDGPYCMRPDMVHVISVGCS